MLSSTFFLVGEANGIYTAAVKKIHTLLAIALVASLSLTSALADKIGDKAKALSISEWIKGATAETAVDVTDGKNIYVVEFWATWCGPCRSTIPHLTKLQKEYKDKGVIFVGISNETLEKAKPFVEEQGEKMEYIVALDKENATNTDYMRAYGQNGIPCAFIINKDGKIVWVGHPMSMEKPLKEVLDGTYDLAAAIKAGELTQKIAEYGKLAQAGDPKAKEMGLGLLKEVGKNSEGLMKMLNAAQYEEDFEVFDKTLDQLATVDKESAEQAERIRKQVNSQRVLSAFVEAVKGGDAAAIEPAQKKLVETAKGNANELANAAYMATMELGDKVSKDFISKLLDLADQAVKEKGKEGLSIPISFYRALISYKQGNIEEGDKAATAAMKEIPEDNPSKKQLQAYLENMKATSKKAEGK